MDPSESQSYMQSNTADLMQTTQNPDGGVPPPEPCRRGVYLETDYSLFTNIYGQSFFQPKRKARLQKLLHRGIQSTGDQIGPHFFPFLKLPAELRNEVYRCALLNRGAQSWTRRCRKPAPGSALEQGEIIYKAEDAADAAVTRCSICCKEAQGLMRKCEGGCKERVHETCFMAKQPKVTSIGCGCRRPCTKAVDMFLCPKCRFHGSTNVALLRVSKQVHREATAILYGEVTFFIEISSRSIIFLDQDFGMTDFRFAYLSLLKRIHVKITYPYCEVANDANDYTLLIRDNVRNVCMQLARIPCLRQLVIEFDDGGELEDETNVVLNEDVVPDYVEEYEVVMSLFGRLRHVGEVKILNIAFEAEDEQLSDEQKEEWETLIKGSTPAPALCKLEKMYMTLRIFAHVIQDPENSDGRAMLAVARKKMDNGDEEGFYTMKCMYEKYASKRLVEIKRAYSLLGIPLIT